MEELAVECAGEDWCPLTSTADLIGRKWHLVIIERLMGSGGMGFNRLKDDVGAISSKVLSETLEDLREKQLVEKNVISDNPKRVNYTLTELGESLEPVVEAMNDWGRENLVAPDQRA